MNGAFLGIDLIAGLDEAQSQRKINEAIGRINKGLQSVTIKIHVDNKVLGTIREFNREMKKLSGQADAMGVKMSRIGTMPKSELNNFLKTAAKDTQNLAKVEDARSKANQKNLDRETAKEKELLLARRKTNEQTGQSTETRKSKDGINTETWKKQSGEDGWTKTESVEDFAKRRKLIEQEQNEVAKLQEKIARNASKIRETGYFDNQQLKLIETKGMSNDIQTLKNVSNELDNYSRVAKKLPKKNQLQNTIDSLKRLQQYGMATLPRKNFLTDLETQLKNTNVTKDLDEISRKISNFQKTSPHINKGLGVVDSLRESGNLGREDMKELTRLRGLLRKAETPENAMRHLSGIEGLEKKSRDIAAANKSLEREANQRARILARLKKMEQDYARFAKDGAFDGFRRMASNTPDGNLKNLNLGIGQYEDYLKRSKKVFEAQQKFEHETAKLENRFIGKRIPDKTAGAYENLHGEFLRLTQSTKNLDGEIARLFRTQNKLTAESLKAGEGLYKFSGQLTSALLRVPIYAATISTMYAPMMMFRDALQQTIDLNSQMVVLERVSNGAINMNETLESSIDIANRLGNVISEVNDGLISFARQGYRGDDLTTMTEYATLMSNISDLTVDDASSSLTAAMKGFNYEANESLHIVNALNEVNVNQPPYTVMYM